MITRKRLIASIVSFSMLFSLIGPNMVLASETNEDPTVVIETSVPEEEQTDVTLSPEQQDPEEPAESSDETEAPTEETSDPTTEETADPTAESTDPVESSSDEETDKETEAPVDETSAPETEPEETTVSETEPTEEEKKETEPPKRGAAKGPTRGGATATAGSDAYALLYDDGTLVFQQGATPDDSKTLVATYEVNAPADSGDYYRPWNETALSITTVVFNDRLVGVTSLQNFFQGCNNLTTIENLSYLDTSSATNMISMFAGCSSLASLDLSTFDTSSVTTMYSMVSSCSSLETLILDNWDLSSISGSSSMGGFGSGTSSLTTLSCKNWTNIPANFSNGFARTLGMTSQLTTFDCTGWTFPVDAYVDGMFADIKATTFITTGWDVSNLTDATNMFQNLKTSSLDLTSIDFSNLTSAMNMFNGVTIDTLIVDFPSANYTAMFSSSTIGTLDLSNMIIDSQNSTVSGMFSGAKIDTLILNSNTSIENVNVASLGRGWYNTTAQAPSDFANNAGGTHVPMTIACTLDVGNGTADYDTIYTYNDYIDALPTPVSDDPTLSFIGWYDISNNKIDASYIGMPDSLTARYSYVPQEAIAGSDAYAVLYTDGTLVIQKGNTADPAYGTISNSWAIAAGNSTSHGWTGNNNITKVVVKDRLTGRTNFNGFFTSLYNCTEVVGLDNIDFTSATTAERMFYCLGNNKTTASISGIKNINFNSSCNNFKEMFYGSKLASLPDMSNWNMKQGSTCEAMFRACASMVDFSNAAKFDASKVTNMALMFDNSTPIKTNDLDYFRDWDVSNVTTMQAMFRHPNYSTFKVIDNLDALANWDTSNVTDMSEMFRYNFSLTNIDGIGGWDVSKVTTMSAMFDNCTGLEYVNSINGWDLTSLTNASSMFANCTSLISVEGLTWNAPSLQNMTSMFNGCSTLNNIGGLASWNPSSVTTLRATFSGCTSLVDISPLANWNTSNLTDLSQTFYNCSSIQDISPLENWDVSKVTTLNSTFFRCSSIQSADHIFSNISNKCTNMSQTFCECSSLDGLDGLVNWDVSNVTTMYKLFTNCSSLTSTTGMNWETSNKLTDITDLFRECRSLQNLDGLANWDVSSIQSFNYIFYNCKALTDISGLENWTTDSVKYINNTFAYTAIENVDALENWNTSNVVELYYTFYNCENLTDISGIENWNVSKVTDTSDLFAYTGIEKADLGNWTTATISRGGYMFCGCPNLIEVNIENFTFSSHPDHTFINCPELVKVTLGEGYLPYPSASTSNTGLDGNWIRESTGEEVFMLDVVREYTAADADTYYKTFWTYFYSLGGTCDVSRVKSTLMGFVDLDELPTATKSGYSFDGWFLADGTQFTSYPVGEKITKIYAHWTFEEGYTLVLDPNMANVDPISVELEYYDVYRLDPTTFTRDGYAITGWSTTASGNGGQHFKSNEKVSCLAENGNTIVLYAQWKEDRDVTVTVHYLDKWTGETLYPNTTHTISALNGFNSISPAIDYYEDFGDGNFIEFWSFRGDLDKAHYVDPYDRPYYSFNYTDETLQLIHMSLTEFDSDCDIYAYVVQGNAYVVHFPSFLTDAFPNYQISDKDGNWYGDGEYVYYISPSITKHTKDSTNFYVDFYEYNTYETNSTSTIMYNISQNTIWPNMDSSSPINTYNAYGQDNYWDANSGMLDYSIPYDISQIYGGQRTYGQTFDIWVLPKPAVTIDYNRTPAYSYTNSLYTGQQIPCNFKAIPVNRFLSSSASWDSEHIFDGWYTAPVGGTLLTMNDYLDLSETTIIYAHWIDNTEPIITPEPTPVPVQYTVTFDSQGGSAVEPIKVWSDGRGGNCIGRDVKSTKEGFRFGGWYTEPNGEGTEFTATTPVTADIIVYANWVGTATITFNPYGENAPATATVTGTGITNNQKVYADGWKLGTLPGCSTNYGDYIFLGWFTEQTGGTKVITDDIAVDGTTYYGHWMRKSGSGQDAGYSYTYEINWVGTTSDMYHVTDVSNLGYLTHGQKLHIRFSANDNSNTIPAGTIKIIIPNMVGTAAIGSQLAQYPNVTPGMFFSYYIENGNYIITNTVDLNGGAGIDTVISYDINASSYPGGDRVNGTWTDGKTPYWRQYYDIKIEVDTNNDGVLETDVTRTLGVAIHSESYLNTPIKMTGTGYRYWQGSWGEPIENDDQYFYVVWDLTASGQSGQSANAYLYLTSETEGTPVRDVDSRYIATGSLQSNGAPHVKLEMNSIIMKYPVSMLEGQTGRIHINETAELLLVPNSAFNKVYDVQVGDVYMRWDTYPQAEVQFYVGRVGSNRVLYQLSKFIQQHSDITDMQWQVGYKSTAPMLADHSFVKETLALNIGEGDFIYSSGAEDDYAEWLPNCGNIYLSENDYRITQVVLSMNYWTSVYNDDPNIMYGRKVEDRYVSVPVDIYIRYKGSDELEYYQTKTIQSGYSYSYNDTVSFTSLPKNVVEVECRTTTDGQHFYYDFCMKPTVNVIYNARTASLFGADYNQYSTSVMKATGSMSITLPSGATTSSQATAEGFSDAGIDALLDLYEISRPVEGNISLNTNISYSRTDDINTGKQTQSLTYSFYNKSTTEGTGDYRPINKGRVYVNVPDHTTFFFSGISGKQIGYSWYSTLPVDSYTVSYISNGNGGKILVIDFDLTNTSYKDRMYTFNVSATAVRTYQEIEIYGTSCTTSMCFVNMSQDMPDYSSYASKQTTSFDNFDVISSVANNRDYDWAAGKVYPTFVQKTADSWGFSSYIANSNGEYTTEVELWPGEKYSHELFYAQSSDTNVTNVVIHSTLDGQGTFDSIEVPTLTGVKTSDGTPTTCVPVLWYCLTPNPDFTHIDAEHGWTQGLPTGQVVYGLYADASKDVDGDQFTLNGKKYFAIIVNEKASTALEEYTMTNQGNLDAYNLVINDQVSYAGTTIARVVLPDIDVIKSANPASGTVAEPAQLKIEQDLVYTVQIVNNENRIIENVGFSDELSNLILMDTANVKLNGTPITGSMIVSSVDLSNNKVSFVLKQLPANSSITITIPTSVRGQGLITNTAYVTSFLDIELDADHQFVSNTTYHEVSGIPDPTGLLTPVASFVTIFSVIACAYVISQIRRKKRSNNS